LNHWIIVPVILPAIMAGLIVMILRHDRILERTMSLGSAVVVLAVSIGLVAQAASGPPQLYELGSWPAPFGIVLVLDRLSALMLVLSSFLAVLVLVYAMHGWDRRGRHFHGLFQFQLMGLNGAFLTGDIFNLFVFFEVLLIASYGLMLHGAGAERLKAGTHYVVVNLTGSTLFLIAVGLIYAVTGTLNMADLARTVPEVAPEDQAILQTGGLLLLLVFGIKAALVPLHFWLPGTYGATSAPVAALFAIMTKVGGYAIIRVYTLVFGGGAGEAAWLAQPWLLPAALVTLVLGMVGVMAARSLRWMVCFSIIGSMGTLLTAIAMFTETAIGAGLYYLVHSTLIASGLFLLSELIGERRGGYGDSLELSPSFAEAGILGGLFFLAAISAVGMPPLSGFIGKLLILDGTRASDVTGLIWAIILVTSLLTITAFGRAGSRLFWKSAAVAGACEGEAVARPALPIVVAAVLVGSTAALAAFAAPVMSYMSATAAALIEPSAYITAVLGAEAVEAGTSP